MRRTICFLAVLCVAVQPLWAKTAKHKSARLPQAIEFRLRQKLVERLEKELPSEKNAIESIFSDQRLVILLPQPVVKKKEFKRKRGVNYYFQEPTLLLSEESWRRGREYMEKHAAILALAEEKHGVPKEIIVAILRTETYLGKGLGDDPAAVRSYFKRGLGVHPAINTLYTLYIRNKGRALYAVRNGRRLKRFDPAEQIVYLVKICLENGWDIFAIPGSSAGAIGIPQFMPSSYANHELVADGDGDGKINLFRHEDSITSVQKYLVSSGWGDAVKQKKKALRAYNKETAYVKAVLIYSELVGKSEYDEEYVKKFTEPQQPPKKKNRGMPAVPKKQSRTNKSPQR